MDLNKVNLAFAQGSTHKRVHFSHSMIFLSLNVQVYFSSQALCFNVPLISDLITLGTYCGVIFCECFYLASCLGAHTQP